MKKFENTKIVLFDSTNASFRLAVETQFTRGNPQQGYRDLVYVTSHGTGILNPNIYLTLSYKSRESTDDIKPVYTSYPQLFRLREALEKMKDIVADKKCFLTDTTGTITVKSEYNEPIILLNIGKANNWISLKPCVSQSGENGVLTYLPGVSIELSTSNGAVSALSVDEFLTVYTIIKDLNLSTIQCCESLAFLAGEREPQNNNFNNDNNNYHYGNMNSNQYYQQPQNNYYTASNNGNNNQQQSYYHAPRANGYSKPRFNSYPTNNSTPRVPYSQPSSSESQTSQPETSIHTEQPPLPKRSNSAPIMNLNSVEDTPVSTADYDDQNAVDEIFAKSNSDEE